MTGLSRVQKSFFLLVSLCAVQGGVWASQETDEARRMFRPDSTQAILETVRCATGTLTTLELSGISRSIRLDGNEGEGHFVLRSKADGSVLWKNEYSGQWRCLGFNATTQTYLIGGLHTSGIVESLDVLMYLPEMKPAIRYSHVVQAQYRALAVVASPGGRYLAFIGGKDMRFDGLYVLDTTTDHLTSLGVAPAAPPGVSESAPMDGSDAPWGWNEPENRFLTLDPGILYFENDHLLKASYGKDTRHQRAKKRTVKKWDLHSDSTKPAK